MTANFGRNASIAFPGRIVLPLRRRAPIDARPDGNLLYKRRPMPRYSVVSAAQLRGRLEPLFEQYPTGALAFDADGTLWAHDVGCMVYDFAWQGGFLDASVIGPLRAEFEHNSLHYPEGADANELARLLGEAFARGECDDRRFAEMQVWCYAGRSEAEMRELTRRALEAGDHTGTLHREVLALAEWARSSGLATLVVSASPRSIVVEAVRGLGFDESSVAGGVPAFVDGVIAPKMGEPLPYGPGKVTAALALLGERPLIAGFGDSTFDLDLLRAAHVGVGLGRKPAFLAGLEGTDGAVYLSNP